MTQSLVRGTSLERRAPRASFERSPSRSQRRHSSDTSVGDDAASLRGASSSEPASKASGVPADLSCADFKTPRSTSSAKPDTGALPQCKRLRRPAPKKMRGSHDQSVLSKGGQSRIPDLCDKLVQKYNLSDREVLEMVSTLSARLLRRSAEGAEGASGLQVCANV